jgi:hypothetical protein
VKEDTYSHYTQEIFAEIGNVMAILAKINIETVLKIHQ